MGTTVQDAMIHWLVSEGEPLSVSLEPPGGEPGRLVRAH